MTPGENGTARWRGWAWIALAGTIGAPCHAFEPEPVRFGHEDEIIRGQGFAVVADRRVFAVTAFLNATGYDEIVEGQEMVPLRRRVRARLDERLTNLEDRRAGTATRPRSIWPAGAFTTGRRSGSS